MEGTEKQIKWAEEIKDSWIESINHTLESSRLRVLDNDLEQKYYDIHKTLADNFLKKIETLNAKQIIDKRMDNMAAIMSHVANQLYTSYINSKNTAE